MITAKFLKLRNLQAQAKLEYEKAEEVAAEKQLSYHRLWLEFLDEAEACGWCRVCLKPKVECSNDHILMAGLA